VKATVVNLKKENVGELELEERVFGVKDCKGMIYDVVKMQRANRRSGSAASKNHAFVSGTTAKMYRQKGTGRARHGDYRTNVFVGGGKAFGPHPRDYSYNVPKKVKKGALRSVLSQKYKDGKIMIVDDFNLSQIKTKAFIEAMKKLGVQDGIVVLDQPNINVERSARNVPSMKVLHSNGLNVFDLLNYDQVVITKSALGKIQEVLKS